MALALPLLMLLLLAIVQFALWQYSAHAAASAARQAVEAARVQDADTDAGPGRARVVLDQLGRNVLTDPHISVDIAADTVTVHITGHTVSLIPGLAPKIDVHSSGVIEKFRPEAGAP
jgi:Flp pilus assembly protein TadG